MKTRTLHQLARILRKKHAILHSWPKASVACGVLTADGRPDPGLAQRIARHGYNPARIETRDRLGLSLVCNTCGKKVKNMRQIAWLDEAIENLRRLEATAKPAAYRVYGRGGRRAVATREE